MRDQEDELPDPTKVASGCPGCGLILPASEGPVHPYMLASPACWALYGDVLARSFNSFDEGDYRDVHQILVDAYAAQHPGRPERRSIQSVNLHLMTLCMVLEDGADPREGTKLHKRMVERPVFHWLEPPSSRGRMTILDVARATNASEYNSVVRSWARDVWDSWAPHHATIRTWVRRSLSP